MVVEGEAIMGLVVKKIQIDQGSLVTSSIRRHIKKRALLEEAMIFYDELIYGFSRECVCTRGYIDFKPCFMKAT